ncbi:MAG: nicotinate phosphoribosyltransferase [Clostridiales bacterium]|jgi:nicotinate phosphoribosyltransferase|nr:nicotinate phosphoribosyltransferase [Clostridiales bacterium]
MSENLTLLTDLYELTMMQGFLREGMGDHTAVFDLFYRENPSGNGFAIAAGLERALEYINNLRFDSEDIKYLTELNLFDVEFLNTLNNLRFTGDVYAVPEGTVVFPQEPLLKIKAPIFQAQLLETALLTIINHQTLIATKAARVCSAAQGSAVLEFGQRRAQGPDAGLYGARAAVVGGCAASSNVLAGKKFNIPIRGTHAHSWVMSFEEELTAFRAYANCFPDRCVLLVDTYDTLRSGVPNAIKVFSELKEQGELSAGYGIRLDSGDLAYMSKRARLMLDEAGFKDALITASGDLDEYLISQLKLQDAKIDTWGVGTNLITSRDCPSLGGVYKLVCEYDPDGVSIPKIKLSENLDKVTNPGDKKIIRLYDVRTNKFKADLITLVDEIVDPSKDLTIFDPRATWKRLTLEAGTFKTRELLIPVIVNGKQIYTPPHISQISEYRETELNSLWDEYKRLVNPQIAFVDLSQKLYDLKQEMISAVRRKNSV